MEVLWQGYSENMTFEPCRTVYLQSLLWKKKLDMLLLSQVSITTEPDTYLMQCFPRTVVFKL